MSLLGIDLGTSSCKAVVFAYDGTVLAEASKSYETYSIKPNYMELDANLFFEALVHTVREVVDKTTFDPVIALALSTQGETVIAVDGRGMPVRPAFMNADNRATDQIDRLSRELGRDRLYDITGEPPHSMYGVSDLMWFRENEPVLYGKAAKLVSCEDYIMMRLGFDPLCNYSSCCRTLMLDIRKRDWSDEILRAAGISREKLGIPVPSGTIAGRLSREMAVMLHLNEGTFVVTGGHDCPCSAFGAGAIEEGNAAAQAGTYEGITLPVSVINTTSEALKANLNTYCHVLRDRYVSLALFPAGFVPKWFVSQFCERERVEAQARGISIFDVLEEKVARMPAEPTNMYVLPHFVGSCNPHNDVRATGVIVGLTPSSDRVSMYKAVYEGIAYEFKIVSDILSNTAGHFQSVRINGSGGKSAFTLALRAATSGRTLLRLETENAGCQGAAMLAGIAAGIYRDERDAVERTVKILREIKPDPALAEKYKRSQAIYEAIYPALLPIREAWNA